MSESPRIVVVGSLNYDVLFEVEHLPQPGETLRATTVALHGGGKGANQATQVALLGETVTLIGTVGDDSLGRDLTIRLAAAGVATNRIRSCPSPTGVGAVSYLPNGTVSATIGSGANYALTSADIDDALPSFQNALIALFQLENPPDVVAHGLSVAHEQGCVTVLNAAPAVSLPPSVWRDIDVLVVNEVEGAFYLGWPNVEWGTAREAAETLRDRYGTDLVVTFGGDGSVVAPRNGPVVTIPARAVHVVETTGAGDSYIGAMAVALARGEVLEKACELGTLAASLTVQAVGAQDSMPTWNRINEVRPTTAPKEPS